MYTVLTIAGVVLVCRQDIISVAMGCTVLVIAVVYGLHEDARKGKI